MTSQRWLDLWESTLRHALEACVGVPTVLFQKQTVIPEGGVTGQLDAKEAIQNLKQDLEDAGVRGLHMPDDEEIQTQFLCASKIVVCILISNMARHSLPYQASCTC